MANVVNVNSGIPIQTQNYWTTAEWLQSQNNPVPIDDTISAVNKIQRHLNQEQDILIDVYLEIKALLNQMKDSCKLFEDPKATEGVNYSRMACLEKNEMHLSWCRGFHNYIYKFSQRQGESSRQHRTWFKALHGNQANQTCYQSSE